MYLVVAQLKEREIKMKKVIKLSESELKRIIKESVKKHLNEITGWAADPEDFVIIGGKLDPNKTYQLIKISQAGGIYAMFVTEYKEYWPDMLKDIKDYVNDPDMFHPMQDYINDVHKIMNNDGVDEETAEAYANDVWIPCWDYDFAVYAPYGTSGSKPMSGAEMQKRINDTAKDSWLRH